MSISCLLGSNGAGKILWAHVGTSLVANLISVSATGLDPQARIEVWQAVKQLAEHGTTVLLTTQ